MHFSLAAIEVSFSNTTFDSTEGDGVASVLLTLSRPTPCCIHLYVEVENMTADGKLCVYDVAMPVTTAQLKPKFTHARTVLACVTRVIG